MKVVDATWEKRNLGVDVTEVTCTEKDSVLELREVLQRIKVPYSVIKIPSGATPLLVEAQKNGYSFAEAGFEVVGDMHRVSAPDYYKRFEKHIRMEKANEEVLNRILQDIKKGEIFESDRIATDPYFSREIAGQRYYNWAQDILAGDAFMGVMYYKDTPVAFNLSKPYKGKNDTYDGILGGVLPEYADKGLGFLVVYGENEICKLHGGRYCIGRVSSNNIPILRLHILFGYEVRSMTYVFIKHQ